MLSCFLDGDENGGEEPGEEQQGPQKPKKVLTLTLVCNLTIKHQLCHVWQVLKIVS